MITRTGIKLLSRPAFFGFSTGPSFDQNKDYYKILEIAVSSSDSDIKKAYYQLAKKYHPDHNKGTQAKFKEINEAYSILSDKAVKKDYDQARAYQSHNPF